MQFRLAMLVTTMALFFWGCSPTDSFESSKKTVAKQNVADLLEQYRARITTDELKSLEFVGNRASDNGGLRVQRQVEIATPIWIDLVSHGSEAQDQVAAFLQDEDPSVRLCTATLLSKIKVSDGLKPCRNEDINNLIIPLLEMSLESSDQRIRFCGASGLGDLHRWSDETLERLAASLPKLRKLADDENAEVRSVAFIAYQWILGRLAERSKDSSIRQSSRDELTRIAGEKW